MNPVASSAQTTKPARYNPLSPRPESKYPLWQNRSDLVLSETRDLVVLLARSPATVRKSLALRYKVFVTEMGAKPESSSVVPGLERDEFDAISEHVVAADILTGEVLATCRVLRPAPGVTEPTSDSMMAREFDMSPLVTLGNGLVELGRTCVSPGHRDGRTIRTLWAGLLRYLNGGHFTHLVGAVSLPLGEDATYASTVYRHLRIRHSAKPHLHIRPLRPVSLTCHSSHQVRAAIPPLLRSYLRMGAELIGAPCIDADFNCVDLPMLVERSRLNTRIVDRVR